MQFIILHDTYRVSEESQFVSHLRDVNGSDLTQDLYDSNSIGLDLGQFKMNLAWV